MKKRQLTRLTAFLAALTMLSGMGAAPLSEYAPAILTASASETYTEGVCEGFTYRNYGNHIEIIECDHEAAEIIIPSEIDGLPVTVFSTLPSYNTTVQSKYEVSAMTAITIPETVTEISLRGCSSLENITVAEGNPAFAVYKYALYSKDLSTLVQYPAGRNAVTASFPEGLTAIGEFAFEQCLLTTLTIPEGVTSIGSYAFYSSDLTNAVLPDSVTHLGDHAFYRCVHLANVTLSDAMTAIAPHTFRDCYALESVTVPEGTETIGECAFYDAGLREITLPESLTELGTLALGNCDALTAVHIPQNVNTIGDSAFSGCSRLAEITVDEANAAYADIDGVLFDKTKTTLLRYPEGYPTAAYTVPEGTQAIAASAFSFCSTLESVVIPESVTSVGTQAFYGCTSLTSAAILANVDTIAEDTFLNCTALRRVVLPDTVQTVEVSAFESCAAVIALYYMGTEAQWNAVNIAETGNTGLVNSVKTFDYVYTGEEAAPIEGIYENLSYLNYGDHIVITKCNDHPQEVVIPETIDGLMVTEIGEAAFQGCSALTAIALPDTVTAIGDYAFDGTALAKVYCEGDGLAWGEISLPSTDDPIHYAECYPLYYVNETTDEYIACFQNGIAYRKYSDHIEISQMDYGCEELVIPEEMDGLPVTAVDSGALSNAKLVGGWFASNYALETITIPNSVTEINFPDCPALTSIILSEDHPTLSVTDGNILFSKDMTTLHFYSSGRGDSAYTIPETVTTIADYAFLNCDNLTDVIIHDGVTVIGNSAFYHCDRLTEVTLPDGLTALDGVFSLCSSLRFLEIPEGITEIPDYSFFYCDALTSLVIPKSVTYIGNDALLNSGLIDIYYGGTEEEWNAVEIGADNSIENIRVHYNFAGFTLADLNGSSAVDASDATMLLQAAAKAGAEGGSGFCTAQEQFADLNGDGTFDASDAALILQYAAYTGTGGTNSIETYLADLA